MWRCLCLWNLGEPSHSLRFKLYHGHNGREHSAMRGHLGITFTYLNFKLITQVLEGFRSMKNVSGWREIIVNGDNGDMQLCVLLFCKESWKHCEWSLVSEGVSCGLSILILRIKLEWKNQKFYLIFFVASLSESSTNLCKQYNRWPPPPLQQFAY